MSSPPMLPPDNPADGEPSDHDLQLLVEELKDALRPSISVLGPLGKGGMGIVYLGRDPVLKRQVAIKVLSPRHAWNATARARFAREAESAAAVAHPNVVGIYQVGELPRSGTSYFVMQHVEGPTLAEVFLGGQPASDSTARRVIGEVASALAAAHRRQVIHRDIKPANVMVERDTGRAVVLDFGISAARSPTGTSDDRLTATGMVIGTPVYMSPEQAGGDAVTDRSDVYSLGVLGFELLTGRPPFQESSGMALLAAHMLTPPPRVRELRPDVDPHLAELIDACLEKKPLERPSAEGVARAVAPSAAPLIEWPPPGLEPARGYGRAAALSARIVVVIAAICFWGLSIPATGGRLGIFATPFSLALFICGYLAVMYFGAHLGLYAVRARRAGYPLSVVIDVGLDPRGDKVSLQTGLGMFARLDSSTRRRLILLRRARAGSALVALILGALTTLAWAMGWIGDSWGQVAAVARPREVMLLFLPAFLAIIAGVLLGLPEYRVRRQGRGDYEGSLTNPKPLLPRELAESWLRSAGLATAPAQRRLTRWVWGDLVAAPLFVPLIVLLFVLSTAMISSMMVPRTPNDAAAALRAWRSRMENPMTIPFSRGALDSALAASAVTPSPGAPIDTSAAAAFAAGVAGPGGGSSRSGSVQVRPSAVLLWESWHALIGRLPDSLRRAFALAPLASDIDLLERLARSPSLPPLWYFRGSVVGGLESIGRASAVNRIITISVGELGVARVDLENGNRARAIERIRRVIGIARHLVSDPYPPAHSQGIRIAAHGQRALEAAGLLTGDDALTAEARRLARALERRRADMEFFPVTHAGVLMAELDSLAMEKIADSTVVAADRWALIAGIGSGLCWSRREIVSGASRRRWEALGWARRAASDLPAVDQWVDEVEGWLRAADGGSGIDEPFSAWSRVISACRAWSHYVAGYADG